MNEEFNRMWAGIEMDLGFNDCDMSRDRPYTGQAHTDTGERGRTEIRGVTFRDLRDAYIRAVCLSSGPGPLYKEALKGVEAALCENDVYDCKDDLDLMAVSKNLGCEIERLMGIYPNIPKGVKR